MTKKPLYAGFKSETMRTTEVKWRDLEKSNLLQVTNENVKQREHM